MKPKSPASLSKPKVFKPIFTNTALNQSKILLKSKMPFQKSPKSGDLNSENLTRSFLRPVSPKAQSQTLKDGKMIPLSTRNVKGHFLFTSEFKKEKETKKGCKGTVTPVQSLEEFPDLEPTEDSEVIKTSPSVKKVEAISLMKKALVNLSVFELEESDWKDIEEVLSVFHPTVSLKFNSKKEIDEQFKSKESNHLKGDVNMSPSDQKFLTHFTFRKSRLENETSDQISFSESV